MPSFKAPRGASDLLPADQPYWRWISETAARVAESYGYGEIQTPVFEQVGVFLRPGSEGTDIADKEIYAFEDRGGENLALRTDGTHGVARAYIEHGMSSWPQPVRLFYIVSVYRYDRPQAGRYRVHHQFGVEAIGDAAPSIDAEVIDLQRTYYDALGLTDYTLALNTIGDQVCRPAYIEKLRAYYADRLDKICGDCVKRYDLNPLRMLDCKNEPCQPFKPDAPKSIDHLCDACGEHFATLRTLLNDLGIEYSIDTALVRGIDYYTRTAFEFQPKEEGSQSVLSGGGRYDGLIEQLGGQPTPGIGFGSGIERLIINLKRQGLAPPDADRHPDAFIAVAAPEALGPAMLLARDLRASGLTAVLGGSQRSLRAQLRHANTLQARYALVLGAEELATNTVTLRDLASSEQLNLSVQHALARLRQTE
ncbi:MAG TPA: histidine--tRNA ligase [Dehalococcoidia bacterium]|nr:histidine--tRNA ligase [Dehalococcoidia bacterium]